MGWSIGGGIGPLRYSKRVGGSGSGSGRSHRASQHDLHRVEDTPEAWTADDIAAIGAPVFVVLFVMAMVEGSGGLYDALVTLAALLFGVGGTAYCLLVILAAGSMSDGCERPGSPHVRSCSRPRLHAASTSPAPSHSTACCTGAASPGGWTRTRFRKRRLVRRRVRRIHRRRAPSSTPDGSLLRTCAGCLQATSPTRAPAMLPTCGPTCGDFVLTEGPVRIEQVRLRYARAAGIASGNSRVVRNAIDAALQRADPDRVREAGGRSISEVGLRELTTLIALTGSGAAPRPRDELADRVRAHFGLTRLRGVSGERFDHARRGVASEAHFSSPDRVPVAGHELIELARVSNGLERGPFDGGLYIGLDLVHRPKGMIAFRCVTTARRFMSMEIDTLMDEVVGISGLRADKLDAHRVWTSVLHELHQRTITKFGSAAPDRHAA